VSLAREKQQSANKKFLRSTSVKVPKKRALDVLLQLEAEKLAVLDELKRPAGTSVCTINLTSEGNKKVVNMINFFLFLLVYGTDIECDDKLSTAVTTGFLILVLEEREICVECKEGLRHTNIKDPEADAVNTLNECLGNTKIAITLFIVLNVNVILDRSGLNMPSK
jgi:hypothetical protein